MSTEDMIRELRRLEEIHKDDIVFTGQTNWSSLCHDVANRLEELSKQSEDVQPMVHDGWVGDEEYEQVSIRTVLNAILRCGNGESEKNV